MSNILFYSNNCPLSQQLIAMLTQERLIGLFHKINTDNNPNVPPQIKITPTLIIRGLPTPYVAGDAFTWLAKVKQWRLNMLMQNMVNQQQQYLQQMNQNLNSQADTTLGFSSSEMAGMSDIFAYLSNDNATPKTFFECGELGKEQIFTPPLEDGQYKISTNNRQRISETQQRQLQKALEDDRKKQDTFFKSNMEAFRKQYQK